MTTSFLLAGFGGQGILFAGKQLAKTAMHHDKNVTWLPSYGPEMRGGTCNCRVVISDEEIGSPLVNPDILIAMNIQSFDKFEKAVNPGGKLFVDSALVNEKSERKDIDCFYIPATNIAADNELTGSANVIMLGYLVKSTGFFGHDEFLDYLVSAIPASKSALIERNRKAFELGYSYNG